MNDVGKFCPFINKDCVQAQCMLYDTDSTLGPLCSIKSSAKHLQRMVAEDYLGADDMGLDDDDDSFEDENDLLEDDTDESDDPSASGETPKPFNPQNN